jgi:hypothetical protein
VGRVLQLQESEWGGLKVLIELPRRLKADTPQLKMCQQAASHIVMVFTLQTRN